MNLKELVGKLPEADRPAAEAAIQEAITAANPVAGIDSKEKAFEFIGKNQHFKDALNSQVGVEVATHDKKFMAEKAPDQATVAASMKQRNALAEPLLQALLKLQKDYDELGFSIDRGVETSVRDVNGWRYLLAANSSLDQAAVTFRSSALFAEGKLEVVGEGRTVAVKSGTFRDGFGGLGVHIYRGKPAEWHPGR